MVNGPTDPPRRATAAPGLDYEQAATALSSMLLGTSAAIAPLRDWVRGEVAYYEGEGFTPREARAMTAATFVSVFGMGVRDSGGTE